MSFELTENVAVRRLALFASCSECQCEGFRPTIEGAQPTHEKDNGFFYFDLEAYELFPLLENCNQCDHSLREHMKDVLTMNSEDRDYYSQMVVDASRIVKMIEEEKNNERSQLLASVFNEFMMCLRKAVKSTEKIVPFSNSELSPFVRPNAAQVLSSFLVESLKQADNLSKESMEAMFINASGFLTAMNNWKPPAPDKLNYLCETGVTPTTYRVLYGQWYTRVYLPTKFYSLEQFELPEISGVETLIIFVRDFLKSYRHRKPRRNRPGASFPMCGVAAMLFENKPALREISKCHNLIDVATASLLVYQRHIDKRENKKRLKKYYKVKDDTQPDPNERGENELSHKEMLAVLARIVDIERTDHFGDENGEDKLCMDLAKADIVQQEVESKHVRFVFVQNKMHGSQCSEDLIWLVQLKNLFNAQLPKMGAEYITRLIMDPKHQSLALIRNCRVIGGCCFRPFPEQKFVEIVFLAVNSHDQIKGYGTIVMNYMKDLAVKKGMTVLLTYADSFATGYFRKQGFTNEIDVPLSTYNGYIKEYEGATLMACNLHPKVRYVAFAAFIKAVRDMHAALNEFSNPLRSRIYPGLKEEYETFESIGIKIVPWKEIPGLRNYDYEPDPVPKDLHTKLRKVLYKLRKHPYAWPFASPVSSTECATYTDYVKYPSNFKMMEQRLAEGYYTHQRLFGADVARIFSNCYSFNNRESEFSVCAVDFNVYAQHVFEKYLPECAVRPALPKFHLNTLAEQIRNDTYKDLYPKDSSDEEKEKKKKAKKQRKDEPEDKEEESEEDEEEAEEEEDE